MSFVSRAIYQNNLFSIKNWVKILVDFSISKNLEKYPIYFGLRVKHWRFIGIHILFKTQFEQEKDIHTLCIFSASEKAGTFSIKKSFLKILFLVFSQWLMRVSLKPTQKILVKTLKKFFGQGWG